MQRSVQSWLRRRLAPAAIALVGAVACGDDDPESAGTEADGVEEVVDENGRPLSDAERQARRLDRDFPLHGAITGIQLKVVAEPDPDGTVVGWLRTGALVRLKDEVRRHRGCDGGFRPIHPTGYVCVGDGVEVRDGPIPIELPTEEGWKNGQAEEAAARGALVLPPTYRDEPLPYDYYLVKESTVPEYHRLPSRNEQRAAGAKAERYRELLGIDERRAARYLDGADDGPPGTAVVNRYLDRGFFVASPLIEVRAFRNFVRTTQGRYIKQAQLEPRTGAEFSGVELGPERTLPIAWTIRTSRPLIKIESDDGTVEWREDEDAEPIERQTLLESWEGRQNVGGSVMHVLGDRYLRSWFAAVAERIDRPDPVGRDEPWVHVDLSEQTLVLYEGDEPVFATLVSTGVEDFETPTGIYEIERKHVTDTMSNIGPDAEDDRYRIEDVPWTQYFEGSFALHTAFWHTRFGLPRSHGCVNMAPRDAHRVFQATWPSVPEGWHGIATPQTEFRGSHVVITE